MLAFVHLVVHETLNRTCGLLQRDTTSTTNTTCNISETQPLPHGKSVGLAATLDPETHTIAFTMTTTLTMTLTIACPWFEDLPAQWCQSCDVPVQSVLAWCRQPWVFDTSSPLNSPGSIHAHVTFVGEANERCLSSALQLVLMVSDILFLASSAFVVFSPDVGVHLLSL